MKKLIFALVVTFGLMSFSIPNEKVDSTPFSYTTIVDEVGTCTMTLFNGDGEQVYSVSLPANTQGQCNGMLVQLVDAWNAGWRPR